jgi:ferrochelatase
MAGNGPEQATGGVLLLNMGGPDRIESIAPFLRNIFADRRIMELPGGAIGQRFIGRMIVRNRLREVEENYKRIGGCSPIVHWTTLQMEGLQNQLNLRQADAPKVGMAMRYWHPFADEALREMADAGVEHIVGLTLYPHYTQATTGTSEHDLLASRDRLRLEIPISFISDWYDHPGYLDLWARKIQEYLDPLSTIRDRIQLVVSAHGLPRKFVERGDPYVDHIKGTMEGVLSRLADPPPAHLGFQSRTGPVTWIGPATESVMQKLARQGHDALLVWPISFVSDHIETTFEVGMLFREEAGKVGINEYHVVSSLNGDERFPPVLADLALDHLARIDEVEVR